MEPTSNQPKPNPQPIDGVPTDRKDPYWDRSHPKHAEAVSAVTKRFEQQAQPSSGAERSPGGTPWRREPSATDQPPAPHEVDGDMQPDLASGAEARRYLFEEMPVEELRSRAGVNVVLPSNAQFDPVHEGNFLAFVINEGVPAQVATRVTEYYADRVLLGGNEITEQDYEDFRQRFSKDLRPDQIELLVRWHKTEVMSGDR